MVFSPYIQFTVSSFVTIGILLQLFLVYRNDRKSATNRIFITLSAVTVLWLAAIYFSSLPALLDWYLPLSRLTIFFAPLQASLFFLLAHTIPEKSIQMKRSHFFTLISSALFVSFLTLTPLVFKDVEFTESSAGGNASLIPGFGMPVFVLFVSICSIAALVTLIKKVRHLSGVAKMQLRFMLAGILLMLGLIIVTIMVPVIFFKNDTFLPFAPVYVFLFLVMTAVAILRYHLFNIKLIATEFLVTFLVIVLLFEGFLSGQLWEILLKVSFAVLVSILGISLVRSVKREIKEREEVTRLAESLEKANVRLQELDKLKTEFLSIASHQLRTPLSIIKGYIELIQDGAYGKVGKKMHGVLTDMDESNERLVLMVDDFLNITRIEQGRTKYIFEKADMNELVSSVVKELEKKADDKKLTLTWKPNKNIDLAVFDDEKVRHVVFNFIDNAIKYTMKGTVTVTLEDDHAMLTFRVKDTGMGFGKNDQANFFQKFYRGENVQKAQIGGNGLGIYVCRKFIEAHEGKVWATSEGEGKGSEFGFSIPYTQKEKTKEKDELAQAENTAAALLKEGGS